MSRFSDNLFEWVVTYGWAVIILLICFGALWYFGMLDSNRIAENKCVCSNEYIVGGYLYNVNTTEHPVYESGIQIVHCRGTTFNKTTKLCYYDYEYAVLNTTHEVSVGGNLL
jgi:hypothetical protein